MITFENFRRLKLLRGASFETIHEQKLLGATIFQGIEIKKFYVTLLSYIYVIVIHSITLKINCFCNIIINA